jgi:ABC-type glycerol-3-phosphate transport system substrate-binding protein
MGRNVWRHSALSSVVLLMAIMALILAGCGGPKADVPVFMMAANGVPSDVGSKLEQSLKEKVGEAPSVQVITTPIFSMEKLIVEIAAGDNGIIIIPKDNFLMMVKQGGALSLDDVLKSDQYPEGVQEYTPENGQPEKHLYGISVENVKWFTDLKLNGKDLYAFVPANAKQKEKSFQVMKVIAQK